MFLIHKMTVDLEKKATDPRPYWTFLMSKVITFLCFEISYENANVPQKNPA
jgi:hypothetical protein